MPSRDLPPYPVLQQAAEWFAQAAARGMVQRFLNYDIEILEIIIYFNTMILTSYRKIFNYTNTFYLICFIIHF